jgi:molybdopterin molybdotransferase
MTAAACSRRPEGVGWDEARALAGAWDALVPRDLPLRDAVGAVLAADVAAPRPIPHYDSSAMDGWAVAGPPPWRLTAEDVLVPGQAREIVTGGALPLGADAVVPVERGTPLDGLLDAHRPDAHAHVRRAGEEAPAGAVLAMAGRRLSPADVAALVLTGDEVVTAGAPGPGRVRDAFDPLLHVAVDGLGAAALPPVRVGDDPDAIRAAIAEAAADLVVTVGGTGRSRADRLRDAIGGATVVLDGVAMRPGHPALLARLHDGRPLLGLPGNPLAAVAVLLSFLPPLVAALTGLAPEEPPVATAAVALPGWVGGTSLVPCTRGAAGLEPAASTRPNMLRGLAASDALAVVPSSGIAAGGRLRTLELPW